MSLKSKRPSGGPSQNGNTGTQSFTGKVHAAGVQATAHVSKPRGAVSVETIEARLNRKAEVADTKTFATKSLGQLTREQRHKLLYGD
jgi:hypothetical protein